MLTARQVYSSARWDRLRRKRLFIAKYRCERCRRPRRALQVHHRTPISQDPSQAFLIENLEALCKDCHEAEHRLELRPQKGGGAEWERYLRGTK